LPWPPRSATRCRRRYDPQMPIIASEALAQSAIAEAGSDDSVESLIDASGGDRLLVEAARDHLAARVRRRVDDFGSTAGLRLLNRALSEMPRVDPYDWQVRWEHHRKP